jgi:hypothetical protein
MYTKFWSENLKGKDHSEDLNVDARITSEWILRETIWEVVDWFHLAQDRDQRQAPVNIVINLVSKKRCRISILDEFLLASQEGLYYMELVSYDFQVNPNVT